MQDLHILDFGMWILDLKIPQRDLGPGEIEAKDYFTGLNCGKSCEREGMSVQKSFMNHFLV